MARLWLFRNWMYAGLIAGLFLLSIVPLLVGVFDLPFLLVYLQLPIYMIHQVEEHHGDRFRAFINEHIAGGRNALTTPAVVVINLPLVWGVDLVSIYLARFVGIGLGLIAIYLALVNAVVHVIGAVVLRGYNPGLITAIVLFLPFGIWALVVVGAAPGVGIGDHALGLAVAVLIHVGIVIHVARRARSLAAAKG